MLLHLSFQLLLNSKFKQHEKEVNVIHSKDSTIEITLNCLNV
jgi:hypothetical protein